MKTNAKIGLYVGAALIIGYLSGSFIGWPSTEQKLLSGNIGKVNKYGKSTVSPELKALQERMKTDKDFREKTALSFSLLDIHLQSFASIMKFSADVTKGYPEFKAFNEQFSKGITAAENLKAASDKTAEELVKLADGKDAPEYEQLSKNTLVGYMQIGAAQGIIKEFISKTDEFLSGKKISEYQKLAFARDQWVAYLLYDAAINGKNAEYDYWNAYKPLLDENGVKDVAQTMTEGEKKAVFAPIEVLSMDKSKTEAKVKGGTLSDVYVNGCKDLINNAEALQKRSNARQTEQQLGFFRNSGALGLLKNDGSMGYLSGAVFNPLFAMCD